MKADELEMMGLSEAERAALADDDAIGAETDDFDEGDDPDGDESDDAGQDDTAAAGDDGPDDGAADPPAPEAEAAPVDPEAPRYLDVPDIAALQIEAEALEKRLRDMKTAFRSGDSDLDLDDYEDQRDELAAKLSAVRTDIRLAEDRRAINADAFRAYNARLANEIVARAKAEGIDYADPKAEKEFDRYMRVLQDDPDNAAQPLRWFFDEAHAMYKARHGIVAPPRKTQNQADPAAEAVRQRSQRRPAAPPSLALVPQAGMETEGETEFSYLDRLSGMALENAIARLSPDQAERYLSGQAA